MREKKIYVLAILGTILMVATMYDILVVMPDEAQQGPIGKMLLVHVPAAFAAFTFYGVAVWNSIKFLIKKDFHADSLAVSNVEVAQVFTLINLVTGSLWGHIIWGIWWTWDARLTSALVCWLLYAGYLMLRRAIEEPTTRARISAVFNLFAFVDVPIVIFSIKWWRTQHPQPVFWGGGSIDPAMYTTALLNLIALILLAVVLSLIRLRQEEVQREIDSLRRYAHAV